MFAAAAALAFHLTVSTPPNTYSERWLCDLWAGAQCHATACMKDGKERCQAVSKQCLDTSRNVTVEGSKAQKRAACARALLKESCGAPRPPECDGLM
jgi:hypothetical protein